MDYNTHDSLSVAVKRDAAKDIKIWYGAFGWEQEREYGGGKTVHMDFTRPHKIQNKDRLQLLQVRFEMMLNLVARGLRQLRGRLFALLCFLLLLGAAICASGVVLAILAQDTLYKVSAAVLIAAGALFFILSTILVKNIYQYNLAKYNVFRGIIMENLRSIVAEAALLTGFVYGSEEQQNN